MASPKAVLADPSDVAMFSRLISAVQTRGGKELSQPNLDRLQAMHDKLSAGHSTMDEAMREMADFMAEKRGDDMDDQRGVAPAKRAKATTKTGTKKKASNTDGTDKPPMDDDGNGDADDDCADEEETGEGTDGEDKADDQDPAPTKGKKRAAKDPNPPETDDGDGDDDDLPEMEEADEGSPKSKSGKSAKRGAVVLTAEQSALMEIGLQARAQAVQAVLQNGTRALGATFNAGQYEQLMERATYEQIVAMGRDFEAMARAALSPIGRFNPDASMAGGGFYDNVPTLQGGAQTMPRNPADPAGTGAVAAGATRATKGKPKRRNPSDPALYKA